MRAHKVLLLVLVAGLITPASATDLVELYEQTLISHPILKGSEFAIDLAKAQKDQALSRLLPQVSANGNLNWNELTQNIPNAAQTDQSSVTSRYEGTRGVIQARQALFDLPSFLRWQGADSVVLQTEQELEVARMSVTADLIDQYLRALEAEDELYYLQGEKSHTETDLNRIRRMHGMQLTPVTDLYEVEAYYQTLLTKELEVVGAHEIALEKLHETTGMPVSTLQKFNTDGLPPVPGEVNEWVEQGIRQHPALSALDYAIKGADKLIDGAKAEHLPVLSLQMSETYADNGGFDNRQIPKYTVGSVGLQVTVPIYAGGGTEAGVREATARYHRSMEDRNSKHREIEKEIRSAFVQARTGHSRIASMNKEVEARAKARDAHTETYKLGVTNIVDLLEAKKNLLKTQFEYTRSRYDFIRSLVALKLWSGSLGNQDIQEMNQWLVKP